MRLLIAFAILAATVAIPAAAQLALPPVTLPPVPLPERPLAPVIEGIDVTVSQTADRLLRLREQRLARLVQRNRAAIELDARGAPARRGELLLTDPSPAALEAARAAGFTVIEREELSGLGMAIVRLAVPRGMTLARAEDLLRRATPDGEVSADTLHFQSGTGSLALAQQASALAAPAIATPVGLVDGAPGPAQPVTAQRGFAKGAPAASDHGSAMVSLLHGTGVRDVRVADVFGRDPAGGSASALVRALDWLAGGGAKVVSISLAGAENPAVAKAVAAVQRRGLVIVAAVGNDGPAAPPAYPASYPGVIAVTGVDGRARPLIEAGKALHLDYAAPGADILARNGAGKWARVRGTSYAVPLVAARTAAALDKGTNWRTTLDREAEDLGPAGADERFGRGLLCRTCARTR